MTEPSSAVSASWADVTDEIDEVNKFRNIEEKSASTEDAEIPTGFGGSTASLLSVGSRLHSAGRCKPCAFFRTKVCANGRVCNFCHLCPPYEKQRRKRLKQQLLENLMNNMDGRSAKSGGGGHTHSRQNSCASSVTSSTMTPSSAWDNVSVADPSVDSPWPGSAGLPVTQTMPPRRMNPTRMAGPPCGQRPMQGQRQMQSQRQRPQAWKAAPAQAHREQWQQPPQPQWGKGGMWVPMTFSGNPTVQPQLMQQVQPMMYVSVNPGNATNGGIHGNDASVQVDHDRAWASIAAHANAQQIARRVGSCQQQRRVSDDPPAVIEEDTKDDDFDDEDEEDEEDSEDDSPGGRTGYEEQLQQAEEEDEPRRRGLSMDEPNGVIDEDDEDDEDEDSEDESPGGRDIADTQDQQHDTRRHYRGEQHDEEDDEDDDSDDEDKESEDDEEEEEE